MYSDPFQLRLAASFVRPFPVNSPGVGPEIVERVIAARLLIEQVNDDVAVVLHDPAAGVVAFDAETRFALAAMLASISSARL